jgi:glycosyltransferase involved in cell wall biosynthesis
VIALSSAIAAELARCGVEPARLRTIPSAVDAQQLRPDPAARARLRAALGLPESALVVAVVAQLIARKNHALLLGELRGLAARHAELAVVFFGRGPLERRLRAQIARLGLGATVRLAGFRDDLGTLLPGADVLVHPARREGLGVALLEAMSAGVPVVACAAGGVVDVVRHDVTGLLVPPGDGRALAAALDRLLGDAPERERLGAAGRAHVERQFSIERMIQRHLAVYADVAH